MDKGIIMIVSAILLLSSAVAGYIGYTEVMKNAKTYSYYEEGYVGEDRGNSTSLLCDKDSHVTDMNINAGPYIDSIGIKCSNGKVIGNAGGGGGARMVKSSEKGFRKLNAKSGAWIDNVTFYDDENNNLGIVGGPGGERDQNIDCGQGGVISGLNVKTENYVNKISAICRKAQS